MTGQEQQNRSEPPGPLGDLGQSSSPNTAQERAAARETILNPEGALKIDISSAHHLARVAQLLAADEPRGVEVNFVGPDSSKLRDFILALPKDLSVACASVKSFLEHDAKMAIVDIERLFAAHNLDNLPARSIEKSHTFDMSSYASTGSNEPGLVEGGKLSPRGEQLKQLKQLMNEFATARGDNKPVINFVAPASGLTRDAVRNQLRDFINSTVGDLTKAEPLLSITRVVETKDYQARFLNFSSHISVPQFLGEASSPQQKDVQQKAAGHDITPPATHDDSILLHTVEQTEPEQPGQAIPTSTELDTQKTSSQPPIKAEGDAGTAAGIANASSTGEPPRGLSAENEPEGQHNSNEDQDPIKGEALDTDVTQPPLSDQGNDTTTTTGGANGDLNQTANPEVVDQTIKPSLTPEEAPGPEGARDEQPESSEHISKQTEHVKQKKAPVLKDLELTRKGTITYLKHLLGKKLYEDLSVTESRNLDALRGALDSIVNNTCSVVRGTGPSERPLKNRLVKATTAVMKVAEEAQPSPTGPGAITQESLDAVEKTLQAVLSHITLKQNFTDSKAATEVWKAVEALRAATYIIRRQELATLKQQNVINDQATTPAEQFMPWVYYPIGLRECVTYPAEATAPGVRFRYAITETKPGGSRIKVCLLNENPDGSFVRDEDGLIWFDPRQKDERAVPQPGQRFLAYLRFKEQPITKQSQPGFQSRFEHSGYCLVAEFFDRDRDSLSEIVETRPRPASSRKGK